VFSTDNKVDFVRRARDAGYFVRVFFVSTADPRINAARITDRVMEGGHSVPIDKIVSRYERSMVNLAAAVEDLPRHPLFVDATA
jgi:predicted ABC-type ATPase